MRSSMCLLVLLIGSSVWTSSNGDQLETPRVSVGGIKRHGDDAGGGIVKRATKNEVHPEILTRGISPSDWEAGAGNSPRPGNGKLDSGNRKMGKNYKRIINDNQNCNYRKKGKDDNRYDGRAADLITVGGNCPRSGNGKLDSGNRMMGKDDSGLVGRAIVAGYKGHHGDSAGGGIVKRA